MRSWYPLSENTFSRPYTTNSSSSQCIDSILKSDFDALLRRLRDRSGVLPALRRGVLPALRRGELEALRFCDLAT